MNGVTEYPVIELPPSSLGSVQLTCACPVAGATLTPVGADGAVSAVGVTEFDAADAAPAPFAFEAFTTNV